MYDIQESGDFDITIDGKMSGSVRRNRHTGKHYVCVLLDSEPSSPAPNGLCLRGNGESWSWHSTEDTTRDDALRIAHEACQALVAMRAVDTATDAGHVPALPTRAA